MTKNRPTTTESTEETPMRTRSACRRLAVPFLVLALFACGGSAEDEDDELSLDELSVEEESEFAVDPLRFPEMQDGRLDTVDAQGNDGDAVWHVQAINYTPSYTAITYAAWYTGTDESARFAADHQPYLLDDDGNHYVASAVPGNPRIQVERGTTAVGVLVFSPPLDAQADSLSLVVNDSTPPVIRIGPWSVADAGGRSTLIAEPAER